MSSNDIGKRIALGIVAVIVFSAIGYGFGGVGQARADSQYTGVVVDVVEDKGVIFRPSWVNMKTNARSSDVQQYCIQDDEIIDRLYSASEKGVRVTVTYDRPLWVSPQECRSGQAILRSVQPVNENVTLSQSS